DERTLRPRPNYWGALLWRRLMGATVLDAGLPAQPGFHVYAHCERGIPGGVSLLVINNDRTASQALMLPLKSERFTMSAADRLDAGNRLPPLVGAPVDAGAVTFAPATITFLTAAAAGNGACR